MGLPPFSKSLILQGFSRQKSRSVTAFRYTSVVRCAGILPFLFLPILSFCSDDLCLPIFQEGVLLAVIAMTSIIDRSGRVGFLAFRGDEV